MKVIIKRVGIFIFGSLAIIFGCLIFIWVAYNVFSGNMLPEFRERVGNNFFIAILYLLGGLSLNVSMISVGKKWIVSSGFIKSNKNFK